MTGGPYMSDSRVAATSDRIVVESSDEPVRLLADGTSSKDLFEGQAHHGLARAIASLVQSDPGGRVIGLEGQWGSGKSTVVSLVARELGSEVHQSGDSDSCVGEADQRILLFDAWAHQGDPLRRTFLEQLLETIGPWLPGTEIDKYRNRLSGKTSHQKTLTSARLTPEGRWTSGAVLLIPLGAAAFANKFHHLHRVSLAVGVVLLLAPILVILTFWARVKIAALRVSRRQKTKKQVSDRLPKVSQYPSFSFFSQDQNTETTTDAVEQTEPTSLEFEDLFNCILREAMTGDRRLLLVLDNLDRIAQDDARSILATMQTFTSSNSKRINEAWSKDVWTLVPFDSAGLAKLWASASANSGRDRDDRTTPADSTARAFFDKLFEIRFTVPPPVLSDWRAYLLEQLTEALPDRSTSELKEVVRLRSIYPSVFASGLVATEETTPRQLKQFGNQVGSILRQRNDVPLIHIAYYVLLERDGVNVLERIVNREAPPSTLAVLLGTEIQQDLAAIHFGTSRELASQLMLRQPLEAALTTGSDQEVSGRA